MIKLGFQRSSSEHAVYLRGVGGRRLVVGVYVDDLVIAGGNSEDITKFKEEMKAKFKMSDLGLLHYYLGLEVTQSEAGITLSKLLCCEDLGEGGAGWLQPKPHAHGTSSEAQQAKFGSFS